MAPHVKSAREIFLDAVEKTDPLDRANYLRDACGADADLRRHVEALLRVHNEPDSLLDQERIEARVVIDREGASSPTIDQPLERPGTQIGPYKLLQVIGEGGMGVVYMAEQTEPVQRKVALKVIKPGMDSRQVIARFEAERQALAVMDHVNIARVFDAGATDAGRPFFVMELVHGVPITKYCDDNRLMPRQRLELFVPVCQAIQHAHQKGIIHRDIKPSNVMVTLYDGKPVPKVIDFGVAKATELTERTERTLFTQYGTMVGTLEYMSPEQAEMSALGVDTRSDIYSLGVLLYELLTGSTPLTHKRMKEAAYAEILRLIKEEEPPRPSTRLSDSGEALASISANRHTEPAKLTKLVRGELDWIVMKTLEKDRARRYATALGLASDVGHYLADEPVEACPPSAMYRFRKFARRNKGPALAAFIVLLALVVGIIGTTVGLIRARRAEADAAREANEKSKALTTAKANELRAKGAQKEAQANLEDAMAAVDQLLTRLADDRLANVPQMETVRRDLLQDALKFYQKFLARKSDDPLIRREAAHSYWRMARIYAHLGQYSDANAAFLEAIAMMEAQGATSSREPAQQVVLIHTRLSYCSALGGHPGNGDECLRQVQRAVEEAESLVEDFPDLPDARSTRLEARNALAATLIGRQPDEAEKILRESLRLADSDWSLGQTHNYLGFLFRSKQQLPEAEKHFRHALEYYEKSLAETPSPTWLQREVGFVLRNLVSVLVANQRPAEAEEYQRRAVLLFGKLASDYRAVPHFRHDLASAQVEHAGLLKQLGQTADAEKAYRQATDAFEKLTVNFPALSTSTAHVLRDAGRSRDAEKFYSLALSHWKLVAAESPGDVEKLKGLALAYHDLGHFLGKQARMSESEDAYVRAIELFDKSLALSDKDYSTRWMKGHAHRCVAFIAEANPARLAEAEHHFRKALQLFADLHFEFPDVPAHWHFLADTHRRLGHILDATHKSHEAEKAYRRAIDLHEQRAAEFPSLTNFQSEWALAYADLGQFLMARGRANTSEELFQQAVASYSRCIELNPKDWKAWNDRGESLAEIGKWDEAVTDFAMAMERDLQQPILHYRLALARLALADAKHYRGSCAQMLRRFETSSDPNVAQWIVWTCALAPDAVADWRPVLRLAEKAVADDPKNCDKIEYLGAVLYRAGQYQEATKRLEESTAGFPKAQVSRSSPLYAWLFQAMAQHHLGHSDEARRWLDKAVSDIKQPLPHRPQDGEAALWNGRLTLQLLRREAEELLKK